MKTVRASSMFGFTLHHRYLRRQSGQLLCPVPRAGAAQLPRRPPAARRGGEAWPRRQRAGLGLSILPRGGSGPLTQGRLRSRAIALTAGLVRPLPAQRRPGRRGGGQHRRLCPPIPGGSLADAPARSRHHASGGAGSRGTEQPECGRKGHRGKRNGICRPRGRLGQVH